MQKVLTSFFFSIAVVLMSPGLSFAATGNCGNGVSYKTTSDGTIEVTGIGSGGTYRVPPNGLPSQKKNYTWQGKQYRGRHYFHVLNNSNKPASVELEVYGGNVPTALRARTPSGGGKKMMTCN